MHPAGEAIATCVNPQMVPYGARTAGPLRPRFDSPIENKSHWVRDVTYDEDRSQARCGRIPPPMAAQRNLAIGLMRSAGETNIAAACRRFAARPWAALALIGIPARIE